MVRFIRLVNPGVKLFLKSVSAVPFLLRYTLGFLSAEDAKLRLLRKFVLPAPVRELEGVADRLNSEVYPKMVNSLIYTAFKNHIAKGDEVCIVTASCRIWVEPFAQKHKVNLICTELEKDNEGNFTGRFLTPNCNKEEKLRRVKEHYDVNAFERIIVYGNRGGDDAMLSLAHEPILV